VGERFLASISIDNKKKHLGTYDTPQEAALAYDRAVVHRSNRKYNSKTVMSSLSSSSSSNDNKELDSMVVSYLNERGFGEVAKKIGKKLKIERSNKLPAGALQAAGK